MIIFIIAGFSQFYFFVLQFDSIRLAFKLTKAWMTLEEFITQSSPVFSHVTSKAERIRLVETEGRLWLKTTWTEPWRASENVQKVSILMSSLLYALVQNSTSFLLWFSAIYSLLCFCVFFTSVQSFLNAVF